MKPAHIALVGLLIAAVLITFVAPRPDVPAKGSDEDVSIENVAKESAEPTVERDSTADDSVESVGIGPAALEVIHRRKSVRSYTGAPVEREALETALRAGMAAPTGGNRQPWVFMVVTDEEKLRELAGVARGGRMLADAAAAIMVGGVPKWGIPGEANAYWVQDCSAATQNILLAIEALDLGAVWIGIHPRADREQLVREILGLPADVVPLNLIAVGHPTGEEEPKDKFRSERIHWETWSPEQFDSR